MKYWIQFTTEVDEEGTLWHNAYTPDFEAVTQGHTLEECRWMARDLLYFHLEDRNPQPMERRPEGPGWEQLEVPQTAQLALAIKRARKARGMTMREVASELGVAAGSYQRWENPRTFNATVQTLEKLAEALKIKLEVTIGGV